MIFYFEERNVLKTSPLRQLSRGAGFERIILLTGLGWPRSRRRGGGGASGEDAVQRCKSAGGLCKSVKVKPDFRVRSTEY